MNNIAAGTFKVEDMEVTTIQSVPYGSYKVRVEKMAIKESKDGEPVLSIWFRVLDGKFKNDIVFYNKGLTNGYWIHQACEVMRRMETGVHVVFEEFEQFNGLIKEVSKIVVNNQSKYGLKHYQNDSGLSEYEIV